MTIAWDKVLPVLVAMGIIVAVALLREKSAAFSAIAATMPINIPLGMFIVYSSAVDKNSTMQTFTEAVVINMIPTMLFALVVFLAARWGWSLLPSMSIGYVAWALCFAGVSFLRGGLGG